MSCWESYVEQKFDYAGKERPNTLKAYSSQFDKLMVFDEANKGDQEKAKEDYNKISFNLMLDLADNIIGLQLIESFKQNYTGRIREVVTDTFIINYIASQIDHLEKLSPGMPAPAFSYPDTTGNQVSLTDFKGKYVYIDVWATWCRPCIREIPKLKELEKDFGDESERNMA